MAILGVVFAATWAVTPPLASAAPLKHISGNWETYQQNPYQVSLNMWGLNRPNTSLQSNVDMLVSPSEFPNNTTLRWDVTPDPDWRGVNGYLLLAYGNYSDSAFAIPGGPKQIKNISAMTIDADWAYAGDPATGMLSETFLTSTDHALGNNFRGSLAEVGFASKVSAGNLAWANGSPTVGTFTDPDGVTWTVKARTTDSQNAPYYYAYREGPVDHHGKLDFKSYFTFLVGAGKLTGDEYFNGVAYGVEPVNGAASLTINRFAATYA